MPRARTIAVWATVLTILLGTTAVVAIPKLLRGDGDWSFLAAVGDTRDLISAEAAYQAANKGYYGTLECLCHSSQCIPGYSGPSVLRVRFVEPNRQGYAHEFHAGRVVNPEDVRREGASPSSLETFAYVSLPAKRNGKRPGVCGDSTGVVCTTPTGGRPRVQGGQCVIDPGLVPRTYRLPWSSLPDEEPCFPIGRESAAHGHRTQSAQVPQSGGGTRAGS